MLRFMAPSAYLRCASRGKRTAGAIVILIERVIICAFLLVQNVLLDVAIELACAARFIVSVEEASCIIFAE
jgi:hypothetical protein